MAGKRTYIGAIIRDYRKKNKVSLRKFSEASGLSKSYIQMLERNERPDTKQPPVPSLECIIAVAKTVHMDTMELMTAIGMDLAEKESDCCAAPAVPVKPQPTKVKPFRHVPLNQENLIAAVQERRVLLLPFPVPHVGMNVWLVVEKYDMVVMHTVEKVEGGVYTAHAESNGHVTFTLFDIGETVFLSYKEAREATKKW